MKKKKKTAKRLQSQRDQSGLSLSWHNISMTVDVKNKDGKGSSEKQILKNISG